jgi:drug/metabolite transporter (DMT)-like permease
MRRADLRDLVLLAAIWGGSFLFMRMAAPAFGPAALAFVRVAGAVLVLLPLLLWRGDWPALRANWRPLLVLGLTNSALPFLCFGYAALTLPAGLGAIFNAATPLSTALIAWLWLGEPLTRWRSLGLALGFIGVIGLAWVKSGLPSGTLDARSTLAIAACLGGTLLYGHAASFARRTLQGVPAMAMACGSQMAATLWLAVPAALTWPAVQPGPLAWSLAVALAVLCSGVAYILYFRLLASTGPTKAASVTFLVPVFAAGWGGLVLGERVTLPMALGGAVIIAGTALVLGLWPRAVARGAQAGTA